MCSLSVSEGFERASSHKADLATYLGHKLVHEELALNWVVSTGQAREMAFANSWFFLELLVSQKFLLLTKTDILKID